MNILNLYAGIGGNRKLWENVNVTAVEIDKETANVYQDYFPEDEVIISDAHSYLLDHFDEYDFIWSSPPCPTHSSIRRCGVKKGQCDAKYPDMRLYQEIILLINLAPKRTKWVVENVKPYYKSLIAPDKKIHRHYYWCNFKIANFDNYDKGRKHNNINGSSTVYGFNIKNTKIKDKRKALRNMVDPKIGNHFLNRIKRILSNKKMKQTGLFSK